MIVENPLKCFFLVFFFFSFLSVGYIPLGMCCQVTVLHCHLRIFPSSSVVKNLPANAGDTGDKGSIPGSERSLRGGNGYSLQYSCLENPMDRGAWGLESTGSQRVGHDWGAERACNVIWVSFCKVISLTWSFLFLGNFFITIESFYFFKP